MRHFVYILKCKDQTLYTGYTNNITKRIITHEKNRGAKYTRGRGPFKLVYVEEFEGKSEALKREYEIKQLKKDKKLKLISEFERRNEFES